MTRSISSLLRTLRMAALMTMLFSGIAIAQNQRLPYIDFFPGINGVRAPYAGRNEARIGGSRESVDDKLRLDIGASIDLLGARQWLESGDLGIPGRYIPWTLGADFFTWTRLRNAGGFKFPVEAVDYYFGLNATVKLFPEGLSTYMAPSWHRLEARLRIAHISAHLADGDSSFASDEAEYMTYSREFIDLLVARNIGSIFGLRLLEKMRPYAGVEWRFHSIPDTLGSLTPYVGFDGYLKPFDEVPIMLKMGYEARLNTELDLIVEHAARVGVKIGEHVRDGARRLVESRGLTLEAGYHSGRSHYGQHFEQREEYLSLGFAIDF